MRNIKLKLSYDGSDYHGWERQPNQRTLQQTLEEAIHSFAGESVRVIASGRTDAGVHALGQVANFHAEMRHDCATIRRALNAILPDDIRVLEADDASDSFHATHDATGKLYRYAICDEPILDPMLRRYVTHCDWSLDESPMREAAQYLIGTHDFSSFESSGAPRGSSVRTVTELAVFRDGPGRIWSDSAASQLCERGAELGPPFAAGRAKSAGVARSLLFLEVAADGFLYNMVRAIAGTLMNVGRGYFPAARVREIRDAKQRTEAGPTAAPHGLFLVRVDYPR
jgi:tRNA pseudouridine38-40 synthase